MATKVIQDGDILTEREAVNCVGVYDQLRNEATRIKKSQDAVGGQLKAYLEGLDSGTRLTNGELELVAFLQAREGSPQWDLMSLAKANPGLLLELGAMGCLSMDAKAIEVFKGKSLMYNDADPYKMPGKPSTALQVKSTKE